MTDQTDHPDRADDRADDRARDARGAGTGEAPLSYRDVLRVPHVGRLIGAAALSRLAAEMFALTLVLQVLAEFRSPPLAGVAVFASLAPGLVVSPVAGAVLDRFGAARGIVADLLASAAVIAALALVATPGGARDAGDPAGAGAALLVLLAALFSLTSPLGIAGIRTLLPRLVPERAFERANGLDVGSYGLADVLGPAGAGLLFAATGGRVTLLVIATMYGLACLLLAGLPAGTGRTPTPEGPAVPRSRPPARRLGGLPGTLLREAAAGVRYVLRHRVLRALLVAYSLYQAAWGILVVAVPSVVAGTGAARGQGGTVGLLWGITGLTGVVGALVAGRVCTAGRERAAIVAGTLATGAVAATVMAAGGTAGIAAGLVVVGLAAGMVDVGLLTLRQRRTDPGWLGRVLAVSISLNLAGMPIGSAAGGYLVAYSPVLAFAAAGAAAGLGALAALLLIPRRVLPAGETI